MSVGLDIAIPSSWSWSSLKFATKFLNRGFAPDYVDEGPIRAISQASNQSAGLDWSRTRFSAYDGDPSRLKGHLLTGDTLINSTGNGTLGRVGYFTQGPDDIPCVADGHVTVVRPNLDVAEPRYLYYWLRSTLFYNFIYSALVVGATNQIELNREALAGAPIALPPLEEQRRITHFLDAETDRVDRLASLRSRQLTQLDMRERAWRARLFEQSKSGVRMRVKHLLRVKPRYGVLVPEFVDEGVPFIRVNSISGLSSLDGLPKIPEALSQQYARTVTGFGDILLSVVGSMGKATIVTEPLIGANVARAVAVVRLNPLHIPSLFTAWIGTVEFEQQAQLATGADSAQPTLGMEDLANFSLRWPTDGFEEKEMAMSFEEHQLDMEATRITLNRQLSLLAERRQALITAAVTGAITV